MIKKDYRDYIQDIIDSIKDISCFINSMGYKEDLVTLKPLILKVRRDLNK